jgi:hypothetical protein
LKVLFEQLIRRSAGAIPKPAGLEARDELVNKAQAQGAEPEREQEISVFLFDRRLEFQ